LQPRASLVAENLAQRQQLAVLRVGRRPHLRPIDRAFWVVLSRAWSRWVEVLAIVKPATVVGWHRRVFLRRRRTTGGRFDTAPLTFSRGPLAHVAHDEGMPRSLSRFQQGPEHPGTRQAARRPPTMTRPHSARPAVATRINSPRQASGRISRGKMGPCSARSAEGRWPMCTATPPASDRAARCTASTRPSAATARPLARRR
jgi:hypothetical protein